MRAEAGHARVAPSDGFAELGKTDATTPYEIDRLDCKRKPGFARGYRGRGPRGG
jgi:hypothetical protein